MIQKELAVQFNLELFNEYFRACHGFEPFDWQKALMSQVLEKGWPDVLSLPTAAGKTAVLDIAVYALAAQAGLPGGQRTAPRRIVFVVDRRVVVNATFERAKAICEALNAHKNEACVLGDMYRALMRYGGKEALQAYELRGGIWLDSGWAKSPVQPSIIVSTVDQVGSRLLHRGYGLSPNAWPVQAGLLGNDVLIVLDEAHLSHPFEMTLDKISHYRTWAEHPLDLPFHVVRMSATPGADQGEVFPDDRGVIEEDGGLGERLRCRKPVLLWDPVEDKGGGDAFVKIARAYVESGHSTVAVIVNRVSCAREIFSQLKDDKTFESILLTGRCRSHDRDVLIGEYQDRILSGKNRTDCDKPLIVVATQCIEAGADFDFEAMVTECCPLDCLRQRLGRLNRLGKRSNAHATVIISKNSAAENADGTCANPDFIYKSALFDTWKQLKIWAQESEEGNLLDGSASAMDARVEELDEAAHSNLRAPVVNAPIMPPIYCDLWVQTHPVAEPTPDPAIFLHGPQRGAADVHVVWRSELDLNPQPDQTVSSGDSVMASWSDALDELEASMKRVMQALCGSSCGGLSGKNEEGVNADDQNAGGFTKSWSQITGFMPPLVGESVAVRLWDVQAWLAQDSHGLGKKKLQELRTHDSDVEGSPDDSSAVKGQCRPFILWKGDDATQVKSRVEDIQPGDTIVVPASYGGCDRFGWAPDDTQRVSDIADIVRYDARKPVVLRIGRAFAKSWKCDECVVDVLIKAISLQQNANAHGEQQIANTILEKIILILEAMEGCETLPEWLRHACKLLKNEPYALQHPGIFKSKSGEPLIYLCSKYWDENHTSMGARAIPLEQHLRECSERARDFSGHIGLDARDAETIRWAGLLHDTGKSDPRFQAILYAGSRLATKKRMMEGKLLAKSEKQRANPREYERCGYPLGARHELLSVRIADQLMHQEVVPNDIDTDLLFHLIESHHGRCRCFAPEVPDPKPVHYVYSWDDSHAVRISTQSQSDFDSGVPERFWKLIKTYGWWGLSFLEAILRLADCCVSEEESK